MRHPVFPWIILLFMGFYVFALSYYAENRGPTDPSYNFYDSTTVEVFCVGLEETPEVYGRFNNILEGRKQIVAARDIDSFRLKLIFRVNSPRPATIYVNEEALDVILLPGDTSLKIQLNFAKEDGSLSDVYFNGESASMAYYHLDKRKKLKQQNIRASRHVVLTQGFGNYSKAVDSMAARELVFLVEQEVFNTLPAWFVEFEKNEILYQKAYLKLSAAYNKEVEEELLDEVVIDNPKAVFSYYYYLYLNAYFSHLQQGQLKELDYEEVVGRQLTLADSLLTNETHDVFISRLIFQQLAMDNYSLSEKLYLQYKQKFNSQKYKRYLKTQLLKFRGL
ncbi:MAG: hypothetical protein MRZ79_00865 [Bacteroidia bacterium]|nr:hypothetical protein [Bacteroidia bacterium]